MQRAGRIDDFDVAKGVAILLVIVSHLWIPHITELLFSFHMPFFFMVSGYFLSEKYSPTELCSRRFRQLMIPFFITASAILLYRLLNGYISGWLTMQEALYLLRGIIQGSPDSRNSVGAIWFLPALFVSTMLVSVSLRYRFALLWIVCAALISYISRRLCIFPMSIQAGVVSAIYVWVGYWCKKNQVIKSDIYQDKKVLVVAFVFWFCGAWKLPAMHLSSSFFPAGLDHVIISFVGVYVFFRLTQYLVKIPFLKAPFLFCGQHSLMILCFHSFQKPLNLLIETPSNIFFRGCVNVTWAVGMTMFLVLVSRYIVPLKSHQ